MLKCEKCGLTGGKFIPGVLDRVLDIADYPESRHPYDRPPYHYQIPLEFVPGLNLRVMGRLLEHFGSEMAVLHSAERKELGSVVGWQIASGIMLAREGRLELASGGGGSYGKVKGIKTEYEQLTFSF